MFPHIVKAAVNVHPAGKGSDRQTSCWKDFARAQPKQNGIKLPSLCHHPDQRVKANCRVCMVEVEGRKNLTASCSTKVEEGMVIATNSPRVRETVKTVVELILADHPQECLTCIRNGNCELRQLSNKMGLTNIKAEKQERRLHRRGRTALRLNYRA